MRLRRIVLAGMKLPFTFLTLFTLSAPVFAGGWVSGGGDARVLEFVSYGYRALEILERPGSALSAQLRRRIDIKEFSRALQSTTIEVGSDLAVNGVPKQAVNYPAQRRIVFDTGAWQKLDRTQKASLAFHEYLGLLWLDANYELSQSYVRLLAEESLGELEPYVYRCTARRPLTLGNRLDDGLPVVVRKPSFYVFNIGQNFARVKIEDDFNAIDMGTPFGFLPPLKATRELGDDDASYPTDYNEDFFSGFSQGKGFLALTLIQTPAAGRNPVGKHHRVRMVTDCRHPDTYRPEIEAKCSFVWDAELDCERRSH